MNRKKKILIWIVALAVVIPVTLCALPYQRRHYGCVRCRLVKRVEHYCGLPIVRHTPNDCSRWYVSRHPDHEHEWYKSSCTYSRVLFAKKWSCGQQANFFLIPASMQKTFLETSTPQQREEWFELLITSDWEDLNRAQEMVAEGVFDDSVP